MPDFTSDNKDLRQLLEKIKTGKIQLPEFQRGWIWDDEHIRELLISVARLFPIGSIMLLGTDKDNKIFSERPLEGLEINDEFSDPEHLILDGQQRLTSLSCVLNSSKPVVWKDGKRKKESYYYIDIEKALNDETLEEAFVAVDSDRILRKTLRRDVILDLSDTKKECDNFYFPCNQILKADEWEVCIFENFREKIDDYMKFRSTILERFRQYKISVISLSKETSLEAVCKVFEKVNTQSIQLSVFELITAKFAASKFNLREIWEGNADTGTEGVQSAIYEEPVLKNVGPTDFLQTISLGVTLEKKLKQKSKKSTPSTNVRISARRNAILSLEVSEYGDWGPKAQNGFKLVAEFLRKLSIIDVDFLPYKTQLIPLAVVLSRNENRWQEPKIYDKICRWYWCGVFGELYGGSSETRISIDVEELDNWINGRSKNPPRTILDSSFQQNRLYSLTTKKSAAFKGIYALLIKEGAEDFFWESSIRHLILEDRRIDVHHIFPKMWFQGKEIDILARDSIVNKTPISSRTNRMIQGDAPSIYLNKIQTHKQVMKNNKQMNKILEKHGIDQGSFRKNNFEEFFKKRVEYLLRLIEKNTGLKIDRSSGDYPILK